MEFLGSCLSLPLTEVNIPLMETSIAIYNKWLGLSSDDSVCEIVPELLNMDPQFFYQAIIEHLSMVFERRNLPSKSLLTVFRAFI